MSIRINIAPGMQQMTGGREVVEVTGHTVGECLDELIKKFPDVRAALFDDKGKVLGYVDIFVNEKSSYPEELNKPVKNGDRLDILRVISGG